MSLFFDFVSKTDIGKRREKNEDSLLTDSSINLFVVADGMGGHAAGEVASKMAVDVVQGFFSDLKKEEELSRENLVEAIQLANEKIYEDGQINDAHNGMGTTLSALLFTKDVVFIGHVGDSRIYRLRHGTFEQLTEDHIWAANMLSRVLGSKRTVKVDSSEENVLDEDVFLLCSDGLTNMVSVNEIRYLIIKHQKDLENLSDVLIETANQNGGDDNISLIIIKAKKERSGKVKIKVGKK